MRGLVAFPLLILSVVLQSAIVSRISLLSGFADLPLVLVIAWALQNGVTTAWHWALTAAVIVAFVSGIPWIIPVVSYLIVVLMARLLQQRIWQAPLLAMFVVTFVGSLFMYTFSYMILSLFGTPISFTDAFGLVALPSILLNMLLAVPAFWLMRDLARWAHPTEEDE